MYIASSSYYLRCKLKFPNSGGVGDKGQASSALDDLTYRDVQFKSQVPKYGEDGEASQKRGESVNNRNNDCVSVHIMSEGIVR